MQPRKTRINLLLQKYKMGYPIDLILFLALSGAVLFFKSVFLRADGCLTGRLWKTAPIGQPPIISGMSTLRLIGILFMIIQTRRSPAYIFYYLAGRITCKNAVSDSMFGMIEMLYQLVLSLLYNAFGICIRVYAVGLLRLDPARRRLLTLGLILSMPFFLGALERGNSALCVAGLLTIVMQWRKSQSKRKREAALLLIAVSAGLKVYPCFLGILYLKERRWREAERLVIYGIVLFFAPFLFFGGISGLIRYFGILHSISSQDYPFRVQFLKGLLGAIGITGVGAAICNYVFLMCLLGLAFLSRNKTRTFVFPAAAMALFPGAVYRYTLLYFALPLFPTSNLVWRTESLGFG